MHRARDPILYFDNNATTALDPAVVETMLPFLTEFYGNPSSAYGFGSRVREAIEYARDQVAALLGCEGREILFTSCGSEGNNAAIASALAADRDRKHVVHDQRRAQRDEELLRGPGAQGLRGDLAAGGLAWAADPAEAAAAIREDTAVVTVMWANNETGVIFPVEEVARAARAKGAYFSYGCGPGRRQGAGTARGVGHPLFCRSRGTSSTRRRGLVRFTSTAAPGSRLPDRRQPGEWPARRHGERCRHRRAGKAAELAGRT